MHSSYHFLGTGGELYTKVLHNWTSAFFGAPSSARPLRDASAATYKSKLDFRLFCSAAAATWTVGTALAGMAARMAMTMRTARIVCMVLSRCFYTHSTGQSNPLTPTKNTPKRRLASQSGIADGFGLSKKGSILRKICIVPLYGWVFLTRIRSGYQVALEPVVHLAPQNHCYCPL